MDEKKLMWREEERKKVFNCKVFSIWESYCKPPESPPGSNELTTFSVIDATDWAIIVPVINTPQGSKFVMVRQWRAGCQSLSLEFPGGVFESGENPQQAAARELQEETGYKPGKIEKIGEFCPNPAIMTNHVHFFLAENLTSIGTQNLDDDEYVEVALVDTDEVRRGMGQPPYIHALMGSALGLYDRVLYDRALYDRKNYLTGL